MWETIKDPLIQFADVINAHWPKILATLILLVGGWIIAKILKLLIVKGLRALKIDVVAEKSGIEAFLRKGGMKKTSIALLGGLVYWIALIIFLVMILGIWDIDIGLSTTLVPFLPRIFAALVILILGLFLASIIEDLVRTTAANAEIGYAFLLGKLVKWIMVVFIVLTAIQQLEIETNLISVGFLILLGAVGLALGLAFGLGAKDIVAQRLALWLENLGNEAAAPKETTDEPE